MSEKSSDKLTYEIARKNGEDFDKSINNALKDNTIDPEELVALSSSYKENYHKTIKITRENLQKLAQSLDIEGNAGFKDVFNKLLKNPESKLLSNEEIIAILKDYNNNESSIVLIQAVQSGLQNQGFEVGKIDGFYGKKTRNALIEFQNKYNLDNNDNIGNSGKIGEKVIKAIIEELNKPENKSAQIIDSEMIYKQDVETLSRLANLSKHSTNLQSDNVGSSEETNSQLQSNSESINTDTLQTQPKSYENSQTEDIISKPQLSDTEKQKDQISLLDNMKSGELSDVIIIQYLLKDHNLDLNNLDEINKKRFIDEIKQLLSEFRDFDESMVTRLKEIRENMSFGLESGKSLEYYRNMILSNKINTRIIVLQESLKTINGERTKVGNTEYNKDEYGSFKAGIQDLDNKNGLDLFSKIDLENYGFNFKQAFAKEFKGKVDKSNPKYGLIISDLNRLGQVVGEKGFENLKEVSLTDGKTINLEELYKEYNKCYTDFKIKNRVFEFGNKQLAKSENGFGFNDAKYGLGYDQLEKAYEDKIQDVEKMGITDLVIMLRVLFGIVPVAGDVVGGIDDLKQAISSINFDGSIQGIPENLLGYLTGILGVSIVGGKLATVIKGEKLVKVMITLNKVIDRLGNLSDLSELAKNEKFIQLLESMKGIIPNVKELLEKIKNSRKEQKISDQGGPKLPDKEKQGDKGQLLLPYLPQYPGIKEESNIIPKGIDEGGPKLPDKEKQGDKGQLLLPYLPQYPGVKEEYNITENASKLSLNFFGDKLKLPGSGLILLAIKNFKNISKEQLNFIQHNLNKLHYNFKMILGSDKSDLKTLDDLINEGKIEIDMLRKSEDLRQLPKNLQKAILDTLNSLVYSYESIRYERLINEFKNGINNLNKGDLLNIYTSNSEYNLVKKENGFILINTSNNKFKNYLGEKFTIGEENGIIILKSQNDKPNIFLSEIKGYDLLDGPKINLSSEIGKIGTFEELYKLLESIDGIESNSGTYYTSKHLIILIKQVISGKKDISYITRSNGLRNKVSELLNNNKIEDDSYLSTLWKNGLLHPMRQGTVGNCYFIAALNAIKEHKDGFEILKSMIRPNGNGGYIVRFKGLNTQTEITLKDLEGMGSNKIDGQLGDVILERAYWRIRRNLTKKIYIPSNIGGIGNTVFLRDSKGDYLHEGGRMDDVFKHFFGSGISNEMYFTKINEVDNIINTFNRLESDELLTSATFHEDYVIKNISRFITNYKDFNASEIQKIVKNGEMYIECIDGKKMGYVCGHAYSIGEYNTKEGWVELINPHDTHNQRYKIKISQLAWFFNYIVVSKFK